MDFSDAKNPFLFDDPPNADQIDSTINPFLNGGEFDFATSESYDGINPFADPGENGDPTAGLFGDPTSYTVDINPFGDTVEPITANVFQTSDQNISANIFGEPATTVTDIFGIPATTAEIVKPPRPASPSLPPRPPSPIAPSQISERSASPSRPPRPVSPAVPAGR